MITRLLFGIVIMIILSACKKRLTSENPFTVAQLFCACIEDRVRTAEDSSVNINECNSFFFTSRLFTIHFEEGKTDIYSKATLDSADAFCLSVGNIIDTLCLNKVDTRKLKKIPHAKM